MNEETRYRIAAMRRQGMMPPKSGKVPWGAILAKEQKEIREHTYDMNNSCPRCHVVKAKNGKCSMGCDD